MKIIFLGSGEFAVPSLEALARSGGHIPLVVTQPDKPKGRGMHAQPTPVKQVAQRLGIEVYQPEKINDPETVARLKTIGPDLFIVIAYGQMFSSEVLVIPRIFPINIHASLLPKYRGAAPVNWAIINGEEITGVTAIKMSKKMDAGEIISAKSLEVMADENARQLEERLAILGSELLMESLESIKNKTFRVVMQDETKSSFAPKMQKNTGLINWGDSAVEINNLIRGCYDWPGAFTYWRGKLLKIFKAQVDFDNVEGGLRHKNGEVIKVLKSGIVVACGQGNLIIEELQIEGKRRMHAEEFILGYRIAPSDILGMH